MGGEVAGSALTTNQGVGLNLDAIESWAREMVGLQLTGHQIVVVTSDSVAEGAAFRCGKVSPGARSRN